jgi:hypothetical protein
MQSKRRLSHVQRVDMWWNLFRFNLLRSCDVW